MTTFGVLLQTQVRREPGRPLVTFYDQASGERTELSVVTYANWVAKVSSLLVDELELERGDRLLLDLPTHWLGPVWLGAAWTVGLEVVWPGAEDVAAVACGPDPVASYADSGAVVVASALHPLGLRFAEDLPAGVHDLGVEVWSQPDSFVPWDPPTEEDLAVDGVVQGALWEAAAAGSASGPSGSGLTDGGRLFSEANPASPSGLASFTEPFARSGSAVWVRHPDPGRRAATYAAERATCTWPPMD